MGWLEGYANLVGHVRYGRPRVGPGLAEQVVMLRALLTAVS